MKIKNEERYTPRTLVINTFGSLQVGYVAFRFLSSTILIRLEQNCLLDAMSRPYFCSRIKQISIVIRVSSNAF